MHRESKKLLDMTEQVRNIIPRIQAYMKQIPVEKAWLFGSCSRGEEHENSDVDILVAFTTDAHISLLKYAGFVCDLEDILQRHVDLVEENQLLPFAQDSANKDKILIYDRAN